MRYPPSTVNVARLPQAYVPDSSQQNQLIQQIGARVKGGLDQRKAARLRDELLTPEQKQAALAQESINIQEEQAHAQVEQSAAQNRELVRQQSRYQEIMSDPDQKAKFMELHQLDPQMAGGLMSILVSEDEAMKAQVAQQAAEANRFYVNYGRLLASDGKEVADRYLRETARNVVRNGGDVSKMAPLLTLSPDEAMAQSKVMAGATGTVFQLPDFQQAFENSIKEREIAVKERNAATSEGNLQLSQKQLSQKIAESNQPTPPDFKEVQSLRKEFAAETKPFVDVNDAYGRVIASAEDPSPAGDLALIFNYMKVLDPGSTVREGEFANAQNSGAVSDTVRSLYNQTVNGKRLSDKQRNDFVKRAGKLYDRARKDNQKREKEYTRIAELRGINPEEVIIQRDLYNPEQEQQRQTLMAEAEAAIQAGADPEQVQARLEQMLGRE